MVPGEGFAAPQFTEFKHDAEAGDAGAGTFDQACGRGEGSAGGQDVVEDQDAGACRDVVDMQFEEIGRASCRERVF